MKRIFLIPFILTLILASCDQDNTGTIYQPEKPYLAFVSSIVPENILSAENNFSVKVPIVRSSLTSPATAEVILEMNDNIDGIFTLESNTVNFEDGEVTAYINIVPVVDASQIDPTKTYVFNLTLTGDNVSRLFGETTYRASFKYTPIGTGNFVSDAFGDEWPVELEMLQVGSLTLYKAKSLYEDGYDITIIVEGENVTINPQPAWFYDVGQDAFITGTGTISGKVLSIEIEHYVPDDFSYGAYSETLTLP